MARDDKIDAGYFNKPIQFQSLTRVDDGQGGNSNSTWQTVYKCFAHIDPYPGGRGLTRAYQYAQLYPTMEALITIRYQASTALTSALTILYRDRRYQIMLEKIPHEEQVTILIPVKLYQARGTP